MRMRRPVIFLLVLISGIAAYAAVAVASAALAPQLPYGWDMMGGMMGGPGQGPAQSPYSPLIWVLSLVAVGLAVVGASGLVYTVAFPARESTVAAAPTAEPRIEPIPPPLEQPSAPPSSRLGDEVEAVLKVLKPDELRVIGMLQEHGGSYLQKWIAKDSGMSRLQAHRVVSRLAERNLVTVVRSGNTNEVSLASWLMGEGESGI